jgi:hypothetical protein
MDASYIDMADERRLEFDYLRWMRIVLRLARARRVLHLGGGACALPRALASEWPDGRQEVCEISGEVLEVARAQLGLRRQPGLKVRVADGAAFVRAQPDGGWDAVVVDAFVGARIPDELVSADAFAQTVRVAPMTLVNVVDDRHLHVVARIADAASRTAPHVLAIGGRGPGNTVIVAATAPLDVDLLAARLAADLSPAAVRPW